MKTPDQHPRKILVCVLGLVPQIITETVYALATKKDPFIPTEIQIITTREGARRAKMTLLSDPPAWFDKLCKDYTLEGIDFTTANLHILKNSVGEELDDIDDAADNENAADQITEHIRRFTADPESTVYVSLAGGRKTMSFYAGYALSLYGRQRDRLLHVLVSQPYSFHPDFFYPTPESNLIYSEDCRNHPLDTKDAKVTLSEIYFVRMRHALPQFMLNGTTTFSDAVEAAQTKFVESKLEIDLDNHCIQCSGHNIKLPPLLIAWLSWMAKRRLDETLPNEGFIHWTETETDEFITEYIKSKNSQLTENDTVIAALKNGISKDYFLEKISRINRIIKNEMGIYADPYLIQSRGKRPTTRYGIDLTAEQIVFIKHPYQKKYFNPENNSGTHPQPTQKK